MPEPLADPNVRLLALVDLLLVLKMIALGNYTSFLRLRRRVYATPEDYALRAATAPHAPSPRGRHAPRRFHRPRHPHPLLYGDGRPPGAPLVRLVRRLPRADGRRDARRRRPPLPHRPPPLPGVRAHRRSLLRHHRHPPLTRVRRRCYGGVAATGVLPRRSLAPDASSAVVRRAPARA